MALDNKFGFARGAVAQFGYARCLDDPARNMDKNSDCWSAAPSADLNGVALGCANVAAVGRVQNVFKTYSSVGERLRRLATRACRKRAGRGIASCEAGGECMAERSRERPGTLDAWSCEAAAPCLTALCRRRGSLHLQPFGWQTDTRSAEPANNILVPLNSGVVANTFNPARRMQRFTISVSIWVGWREGPGRREGLTSLLLGDSRSKAKGCGGVPRSQRRP